MIFRNLLLFGILHLLCHAVHGQDVPTAVVKLVPAAGSSLQGELIVTQLDNGISIKGKISGLTPGFHGFHIHEKGDLGNNCKNAGGHFNPFGYNHGDPRDLKRHIGDLGNIYAEQNGEAVVNIYDQQATLDPSLKAYVGGLAIVVHSGVDDLGRGGNAESLKTGNAGSRIGCGIIEVQSRSSHPGAQFSSITEESREATVSLIPGSNPNIVGNLKVISTDKGVIIQGKIIGLSPGLHGFHIHEAGDLGNQCKNAGGHFNPLGENHGGPQDAVRHVGDLGNILVDETGTAEVYIFDVQPSLDPKSQAYVANRAIVVHEGTDDLGKGGNQESLTTGNAGARAGCGVIEIVEKSGNILLQQPQHTYPALEFPVAHQPGFASVRLVPGVSHSVRGQLTVSRAGSQNGILIRGRVTGLSPGLHGFHIHEFGDLGNSCQNAGGHFNPFGMNHGGPNDRVRHVGDLGNIFADNSGTADINIIDAQPSLNPVSKAYVGNLAIVIHSGTDDLGRGGNEESLKTGNAGQRVACGIIAVHARQQPLIPNQQTMSNPAVVDLIPGSNPDLSGKLTISTTAEGILIEGTVHGLTPGLHGFHIHGKGDLGDKCKAAGGHFNPFNETHGAPDSKHRHVGDLGNIEADSTGTARISIRDSMGCLDLTKENNILNRAIVIHALPDDLGKGGNPESLKTGNAGSRVGCGLIVIPQEMGSTASVTLLNATDQSANSGELSIVAVEGGVLVTGKVSGLSPGLHGFHIHESGDLGNSCKNAGGHFNPYQMNHGGPDSEVRHVGDLGNIEADENGVATIQIFDTQPSLDPSSNAYIGDRAFVVHAGVDDLGQGRNEESLKTGNAGARVACGITIVNQPQSQQQQQQQQQEQQQPEQQQQQEQQQIGQQAIVDFHPGSDPQLSGRLTITSVQDGVLIEGQINGLNPGLHGFHIHETGDLGNACKNAGPHFNPFNLNHGEPNSEERHVGDLGNIHADENGIARIHVFDVQPSLDATSQAYVGNRAIVVHASPDDLGQGGDAESLKTGNAGSRLGCGIILIQQQNLETKLEEVQVVQRKKRELQTEEFFPNYFKEQFDFSASNHFDGKPKSARVKIVPGTSKSVKGDLQITAVHGGVIIKGTIFGLTPGLHGLHFHEKGDLGNQCKNAAGHFNPFESTHGDIHDFHRHVGDLGNIKADSKGIAHVDIFDRKASLDSHSPAFVGHRTLVVHADKDDLGRGNNEDSKKTGNSGARVGCGIVEVKRKSHHGPHKSHSFGSQLHHGGPAHHQGHGGGPLHHQGAVGHQELHQGHNAHHPHQGGHHQSHQGHSNSHPHQGGHHQQGRHNSSPKESGSHHHGAPVYRPTKPPRLNLKFNFGPYKGGIKKYY